MNRRTFLNISSLLSLIPFVGAKKALAKPKSSWVGPAPCPWHSVRPQTTADDLVAEYKAWVDGDLDDHDKVVGGFRAKYSQTVPGLHPVAYGQCTCVASLGTQVQAQLDREIAQQRRYLEEGKQRMQTLLQQVGRRSYPTSRYQGTLPKWMTE